MKCMDELVGTRDACTELGVTLRTIYAALDSGELPFCKVGKTIRIRRPDLEEYGRNHGWPGGLAGDRVPRRTPPALPASAIRMEEPKEN
jgi:excisionase family DNA binding protein